MKKEKEAKAETIEKEIAPPSVPLSLAFHSLRNEIEDLINKYNLPICISESVIDKIHAEMKELLVKELQRDKAIYDNQQKEYEEKTKSE